MNKYIAELVGTCILALAVSFSLAQSFPVSTPVIAALTLGLLVYTIGPISGCHINPAVTLGLWSIKKIDRKDAINYLIAQFVGALLAYFISRLLISNPASVSIVNTGLVGAMELIGALVFTFGVAAVATGRVPQDASGLVVGGSLLLGISIASFASNGILNPAVALGIGSFSLMYLIGPLIGGILGMRLYAYLASRL
ncbi:MAG: aquaporin [Patescibacteria group bacterium]